jgi:hypothetical protein
MLSSHMRDRNFAATARYFERRASKAPNERRRIQLEKAAAYYWARAQELGQGSAACPPPPGEPAKALSRRRRLIELFRTRQSDAQLPKDRPSFLRQ